MRPAPRSNHRCMLGRSPDQNLRRSTSPLRLREERPVREERSRRFGFGSSSGS
jgi:hypothetical protein